MQTCVAGDDGSSYVRFDDAVVYPGVENQLASGIIPFSTAAVVEQPYPIAYDDVLNLCDFETASFLTMSPRARIGQLKILSSGTLNAASGNSYLYLSGTAGKNYACTNMTGLVVGTTYTLTFWVAVNPGGAAPEHAWWNVYDGTTTTTLARMSTFYNTFTKQTATFVATQSTMMVARPGQAAGGGPVRTRGPRRGRRWVAGRVALLRDEGADSPKSCVRVTTRSVYCAWPACRPRPGWGSAPR
jgi:hypothetical protein